MEEGAFDKVRRRQKWPGNTSALEFMVVAFPVGFNYLINELNVKTTIHEILFGNILFYYRASHYWI
jgi:hypothetical protein